MVSYIRIHLNHTTMKYLILLIAVSLLSCKKSEDPQPMQVAPVLESNDTYVIEVKVEYGYDAIVSLDGDTLLYEVGSHGSPLFATYITKKTVIKYDCNGGGYIKIRALSPKDNPYVAGGKLYITIDKPEKGIVDLSSLPK